MPKRTKPHPTDPIPIKGEHLDELRQRMALVGDFQQAAQAYRDQAIRAEAVALYLNESLTAWLAQEYGIDVAHEAWRIDETTMRLMRQEPMPDPSPSQSSSQ